MNILFVNSYYFMPQSKGGLAQTLMQLAEGLAKRGHRVSALVELRNDSNAFTLLRKVQMKLAKLAGRPPVSRERLGPLSVYRCWHVETVIRSVVKYERPDVVVITGGRIVPIVRLLRDLGVPIVLQVHDVEMEYLAGDFSEAADLPCVANSHFTAKRFDDLFGSSCTVIYPFIDWDRYRVNSTGREVLFVHPVEKKGVRMAAALAQTCPELSFTFIGASSYDETAEDLSLPEAKDLLNCTFLPFLEDMTQAYARARVIIVPSRWEEAYGRIVNEAQVSGIPPIVADRGGLPEAVGEGGIVLAADAGIEQWAETLREIMGHPSKWDAMSKAAIARASQPELSRSYQLDQHETLLAASVKAWRLRC